MFAAGRVVTGVGGAGMRSLVSSLIVRKSPTVIQTQKYGQPRCVHGEPHVLMFVELVPLRDIAGWRSWRKFNLIDTQMLHASNKLAQFL